MDIESDFDQAVADHLNRPFLKQELTEILAPMGPLALSGSSRFPPEIVKRMVNYHVLRFEPFNFENYRKEQLTKMKKNLKNKQNKWKIKIT